jgi:hypothetical protein
MTTYEMLKETLEKHKYKKGAYEGDAPADPSRRSRCHIRIRGLGSRMVTTMHAVDILTAYPDGRICIHLGGWESSTTTRAAINDALRAYCPIRPMPYVHSRTVFGKSQTCVTMGVRTYRYYGGITFGPDGVLLTEPEPFRAKRLDRDEVKELMADITESGFKGVFPLLYATTPPTTAYGAYTGRILRRVIGCEHSANEWGDVIADVKYETAWKWDPVSQRRYQVSTEKGDAKSCWQTIMQRAKQDLTCTVTSTTTEIITGQAPKFFPAPSVSI